MHFSDCFVFICLNLLFNLGLMCKIDNSTALIQKMLGSKPFPESIMTQFAVAYMLLRIDLNILDWFDVKNGIKDKGLFMNISNI